MNPRVPIEWLDGHAAGIYLLFALTRFDLWLCRRDRTRSHTRVDDRPPPTTPSIA